MSRELAERSGSANVLVMENFITCMLLRGQRTSSRFKESKKGRENI
jgi:hypothetical protein